MDRNQLIQQIVAELAQLNHTDQVQQVLALVRQLAKNPAVSNGQHTELPTTEAMSRDDFLKKLRGY
jgi:hypothetical protein